MSGVDSIKSEKYIALFIFLFLFSFIRQKIWRFLSMGMVLYFSFFQFVHLEFYGLPVYPAEIYLLFTQVGEIFGTLKEDYGVFWFPVLISLVPTILLFFLNKKIETKKSSKYLVFLFIFYFIYNPTRTFVTGNTWGRQPSSEEFEGMNIYLSTSYFLGKILPSKLVSKKGLSSSMAILDFKKTKDLNHNVIFVLGESLTPNHMSLFGYTRKTTPFLESLKNDENFFYARAFSAGVSSDVSVAFLMNNSYGPDGARDVFNGKNCVFSIAQKADFKTYFYSTQSQQQLRYIMNSICPRYIEDYKNLEMLDPTIEDTNAADDGHSIKALKKIDLNSGKNFITLHQRGSHGPFSLRFSQQANAFEVTDEDDRYSANIKYYDNSVVQFDFYMKELIEYVRKQKKPTIMVYVSDHGEGLGEEGVWGHGKLNRISFEVPFLFYSNDKKLAQRYKEQFPKQMTHFNISLLLADLVGMESEMKFSTQMKEYIVYGNDIDGFMGYMRLENIDSDMKVIKVEGK
jgi:glucan phosphoethanolaminetransferase (alkaline phosphatase superfamily)